tara:strand:- start:2260 stop:2382 length:123 start_codon:yes stop_codon:yes gene_type:complete
MKEPTQQVNLQNATIKEKAEYSKISKTMKHESLKGEKKLK